MDEELRQLEAELQTLRPTAPRTALRARLQCTLGDAALGASRTPTAIRAARQGAWWWTAALPVAAAIVLGGTLWWRTRDREQPSRGTIPPEEIAAAPTAFKPVTARNVLYAADDEGMVTLDDGTLARRERLHFVDTITWHNPRTNASLTWTVPREEVRIVPVHFQ